MNSFPFLWGFRFLQAYIFIRCCKTLMMMVWYNVPHRLVCVFVCNEEEEKKRKRILYFWLHPRNLTATLSLMVVISSFIWFLLLKFYRIYIKNHKSLLFGALKNLHLHVKAQFLYSSFFFFKFSSSFLFVTLFLAETFFHLHKKIYPRLM